MANYQEEVGINEREFGTNWVTSSKFLFYIQVLVFLAFVGGCSAYMCSTSYKGKPKVEVPESTQYTPKYK